MQSFGGTPGGERPARAQLLGVARILHDLLDLGFARRDRVVGTHLAADRAGKLLRRKVTDLLELGDRYILDAGVGNWIDGGL
jgi:hypothetical protein